MKFEFFDINIYHKPFAWNSLLKFPFSFLLFRKAKCFQLTRIFATEAQIDFQATLSRLLVETKAALYLAKRGLSAGRGRKGNMWATCLNGKHVSKSSLSRPHMWVLTMTHFPPSSPWAATKADKLPKLFNLFKRPSWHRFCNYFSRPAAITRVKLNINVSQDQPFSRGTVVRETLIICSRAMDFIWLKENCVKI